MLVVSFAWIAFVELTPASQRPYVGSSTNNTELGLTFEYNGFGRVEGQAGGPGQVVVRPGAYVPAAQERAVAANAAARHSHALPARVEQRPRAHPTLKPIVTKGGKRIRSPSAALPAPCGCSTSASATRPAGCSRSRFSDCSAWRC